MRHRLPSLIAAAVLACTALAACGSDGDSTVDTTASTSTVATTAAPSTTLATASQADDSSTPKPSVSIPAAIPTELTVTDLTVGTGPKAKAGDFLVMDYVGVRSEDGTEFDNSYDRGKPFTLTLGAGGVIAGWDQGLVGIQQGGRRQLDIPADLAYGDNPPSDPIKPGDALSFVVDAVAVVAAPDPSQEPEWDVEGGPNVETVQTTTLVEGSGPELTEGQTAIAYLTAFRGDTGQELLSSWDSGVLEQLPFAAGQTLDGIYEGMKGMHVGERREVRIPFAQAFGADGNADLGDDGGLPANTDLVLVIEVFGAY